MSRNEQDNHANQMNPNNDAYWQARGYEDRPEEWKEQTLREKDGQSAGGEQARQK